VTLLSSAAFVPAALAADAVPVRPIVVTPLTAGLLLEGWVGVSSVHGSGNATVDRDRLINLSATARAGLPFGMGHYLQADLSGEWTDNRGGDDGIERSRVAGIHLAMRNPTSGIWGIFGGVAEGEESDETVQSRFIGLEHQKYFGNWTLQLQGGWFDSDNEAESIHDVWFVRGLARVFHSPNSSITFEASYGRGQQDSDNETGIVAGWGVRLDHRWFDGVSVFAAYRGGYFAAEGGSDSGTMTDHTGLVGLRVVIGGGSQMSLMTAERYGVPLDLPDFGRWAAAGPVVD
jgi:hypothetical protein